jgi:hypothetical protein
VLDFGLAKASRENKVAELGLDRGAHAQRSGADLTLAGQMLGTPDFIAPEQITDAQKADIRADIYSLGCTLYYLLSGGPPFHGTTLYDILQAHHSMDAQMLNLVRPEVPSELAALVAKMMAKEPKRRFQTPDEVAKALPPFFKRKTQTAVGPGLGVSQADAPATSLSTSGSTQVTTPSSPAPVPVMATVVARNQNRPEEMWKSLIDLREIEDTQPAPAVATEPVRKHPRWSWPAIAGLVGFIMILFGAGITYRIASNKGELVVVIEAEDPDIEVVVKQGGEQITIIDPQTKKRTELPSGKYELKLAGDKPGLRLSPEQFTLKRGDKTVVTVRREAPPDPEEQPALAEAAQDPRSLIERGRVLFESSRTAEADAAYARAARLSPDNPQLFLDVGGWWVAGPYPAYSKTPMSIESDPAPGPPKPPPSHDGQARRWQHVAVDSRRTIDLRKVFDHDEVAVYVLAIVHCESPRQVVLLAGCDDAVQFWINGQKSLEASSLIPRYGLIGEVSLRAGRNTILAKVDNWTKDFWLAVRLGTKDMVDMTAPPAQPTAAGLKPSAPVAKVAPKPSPSLVKSRR